MARFNAWANERLYDSVARLPDAAYRAERKAFFGSIHRTLNHLLVVDRLWTGRLRRTDRGIRALDQILYDDFAALRAARGRGPPAGRAGRRPERAAARRPGPRYRRIIGEGLEEVRAGHVLLTLFNHQTHYRGQARAAGRGRRPAAAPRRGVLSRGDRRRRPAGHARAPADS